jgi:hypothetical protein
MENINVNGDTCSSSKNTSKSSGCGIGTYVHDIQTWISYYDKKGDGQALVGQSQQVVGVLPKHIDHKIKINNSAQVDNIVPLIDTKNTSDMQDIELVSPVQGAVQQARAEYARAPAIKRRRYKKKGQRGT